MTAGWFLLLPINAAISSLVIPLKQKTEIRNLKSRHSRAGGNLGLSARKLIGKNGFFRFYVLDSRFCGNDDEKIVVASDKFLPCWVLDSRFCGNDGRVVSVVSDKFCSPDKKYGCFGKKMPSERFSDGILFLRSINGSGRFPCLRYGCVPYRFPIFHRRAAYRGSATGCRVPDGGRTG
ncbi:hypothetical protein NMEN2781_1945 [Neisseria meningitidis NM2781]|nr:hypothetical protein NMEN2781_1945 [Neisseria meningitidis NM2781]